jgi:hypothetical protein
VEPFQGFFNSHVIHSKLIHHPVGSASLCVSEQTVLGIEGFANARAVDVSEDRNQTKLAHHWHA